MNAPSKVRIRVIGPLGLFRANGDDCTPPVRKSRALIALLALSPSRQRTRTWLQDRLWGTRGREQGAASLRQCLVDIRKALGSDRDCLVADGTLVRLDPARVSIDHDDLLSGSAGGISPHTELLEGLDIGFEDFENWLSDQRRAFRMRLAAELPRPVSAAEHSGSILLLARDGGLVGSPIAGPADEFLDNVGRTVAELGIARVIDQRTGDRSANRAGLPQGKQQTLTLSAQSLGSTEDPRLRVSLSVQPDNEFVWSSICDLSRNEEQAERVTRFLRQSNDAASMAIGQLVRGLSAEHAPSQATALFQEGIRVLFKLGKGNFEKADGLFAEAFERDPRGLYLAWRAYLRTFQLVEQAGACRRTLDDEAFGFLRMAFEREPANSYVFALGAHVHSLMRRSYASAYELAERSIEINPANPIGWACLGTAQCYLGKSGEGLQNTLRARSIAGYAPYRYQIETLGCIAATMTGHFDAAIHMGETSHALAPDFAAPMRYLSALYLQRGDEEQAATIVAKLQQREPDFSYRKLKDRSYPAAGLHRTNILSLLPAE